MVWINEQFANITANWNKLVVLVNYVCELVIRKIGHFFLKHSLSNNWNLITKAQIQPGFPPCLYPPGLVSVKVHLFKLPSRLPRQPFSSLPAPLVLQLLPPVWTNHPFSHPWCPVHKHWLFMCFLGAALHPGVASPTFYAMSYLGKWLHRGRLYVSL